MRPGVTHLAVSSEWIIFNMQLRHSLNGAFMFYGGCEWNRKGKEPNNDRSGTFLLLFVCSLCHWLPACVHIFSSMNHVTLLHAAAPFSFCIIFYLFGKHFSTVFCKLMEDLHLFLLSHSSSYTGALLLPKWWRQNLNSDGWWRPAFPWVHNSLCILDIRWILYLAC